MHAFLYAAKLFMTGNTISVKFAPASHTFACTHNARGLCTQYIQVVEFFFVNAEYAVEKGNKLNSISAVDLLDVPTRFVIRYKPGNFVCNPCGFLLNKWCVVMVNWIIWFNFIIVGFSVIFHSFPTCLKFSPAGFYFVYVVWHSTLLQRNWMCH